MTSSGSRLELRATGDGSPSLWSEEFGEGFHSGDGAYTEAQQKFVRPAQLERFSAGQTVTVLDVGVGLAYNSAALLEAAGQRGLRLRWWGLERDPRPLDLALRAASFRNLWQPQTLAVLEQLHAQEAWQTADSQGRWLLGDARQRIPALLAEAQGSVDLVLHDAFSPSRCPQLWTVEFLQQLAQLLGPEGRLLTYCAAAAVRRALQLAGLALANIASPGPSDQWPGQWSLGTVASPTPLPTIEAVLQPLSAMELEHLCTRAAEPYRDPSGSAAASVILSARQEQQRHSPAEGTSAWRRRWGLGRG
jgi:tRNA U34 5-methylaminomethyl-2-thiouridine-forming methyltransferase MnmC